MENMLLLTHCQSHTKFQMAHGTHCCKLHPQPTVHSIVSPSQGHVRPHTQTCTFAKSTRLRSLSIWLICAVFCSTARAAWARWFKEVYLRSVCANAFAHVTYKPREEFINMVNSNQTRLSTSFCWSSEKRKSSYRQK